MQPKAQSPKTLLWARLRYNLIRLKGGVEHGRQIPWSNNKQPDYLSFEVYRLVSIYIKVCTPEIYCFPDFQGKGVMKASLLWFIRRPTFFLASPFSSFCLLRLLFCSSRSSHLSFGRWGVDFTIASRNRFRTAFHCWSILLPVMGVNSVLGEFRGIRANSFCHTARGYLHLFAVAWKIWNCG